jgi:lipopolysaccharide export LptBFGC system permease protein LptF
MSPVADVWLLALPFVVLAVVTAGAVVSMQRLRSRSPRLRLLVLGAWLLAAVLLGAVMTVLF